MDDAESCRRQAEAFYDLARRCDDAMERLAYILKAMECEARAADAERAAQLALDLRVPEQELDGPQIAGAPGCAGSGAIALGTKTMAAALRHGKLYERALL